MLDEDVVLKAPRYENERLLIFYIPAILFAPLLFGGDGLATSALIISLGLLVPINIATYCKNWVDADEYCGWKFLLAMLPYFAAMGLIIFRSGFPMMEWTGSESNGGYVICESLKENIFATLSMDFGTALVEALAGISIVATALSIYFITQSRFIVRNILAICSAGVAILAALGLFSEFLFRIGSVSMHNLYGANSFATFADASSWSYFAMIWAAAIMGASIYTFQRFKFSKFFFSVRGAGILIALVIAASAAYAANEMFRIFIFAQMAVFFAVYAFNVLPTEKSLNKHLNTELKKLKKRSKLQVFFPFAVYAAASAAFAAAGLGAFAAYSKSSETEESAKAAAYHQTVLNDTKELIRERPVLGWGTESFTNAMAFKHGDDIEMVPIENPDSDILKFIAENGYVGLIAVIITPLFFAIRFVMEFKISQSGIIFLTAILSTLVLSFYSTPFQTASVTYSFWILMFAFFTWEDAEII